MAIMCTTPVANSTLLFRLPKQLWNFPARPVFAALATFNLFCAAWVAPAVAASFDEYAVVWNSPGKNFKDSMPIGNGAVGMNLWTQNNGDIVFLLSKVDAWTENSELVKLGRVRVKLDPSPFAPSSAFRQILKPLEGEIEIRGESSTVVRVWVDVYRPVIHLEIRGDRPVALLAAVELWRTQPRWILSAKGNIELSGGLREIDGNPRGGVVINPDTVLRAKENRLTWCHHNTRSIYPAVLENQHLASLLSKYPDPLLHRTFGVMMKGPGLVSVDNLTLKSEKRQKSFRLDLYALTAQSGSIEQWQSTLDKTVAAADAVKLDVARKAHRQWWKQFWDRSWIRVSGDEDADKVTQGYAMQRWMYACAGRGAAPMKFNGSIFTVGQEPPPGTPYDPAKGEQNVDYRAWGSNYWFQNQRLIYWPMIAAGDFDTLRPFFQMYLDGLSLAKDHIKLYFSHGGAAFPETMFFWGLPNNNDFGWGNPDTIITNPYIRYHINGNIELTAMMLAEYAYTQDAAAARAYLVPIAEAVTTYFGQHFPRGPDGKLLLSPDQALETYQCRMVGDVINPTPDIAGLRWILPRLLALPNSLTTAPQRALWQRLLADLPAIPLGKTAADGRIPVPNTAADPNGKTIILPAEKYGNADGTSDNSENPELYAVFPYRFYGLGHPNLELARNTFAARTHRNETCWNQNGVDAALLGLAPAARHSVTLNFTAYGDQRFQWFWRNADWIPDLDNGGVGQIILQSMLLQPVGDKLLLFPAWPKEWNVEFKLHAPGNTIIEGIYRHRKVEKLQVTPASRAKNIVQMAPQ
jgi:alpha-L-fucosidase 2